MLITFNFSYLESFFVVFYLSFNFFLAPGASAPDDFTQHRNHLYSAMKKRRQRLKTTLQDVQQWLRNNPIPDLHTLQPNTTDNPLKTSVSIYSISPHHPTQLSFPNSNHPPPSTNIQTKNALVLPAAQSLRQTLSTSLHLHSTGHSSPTLQCERRLSPISDRGVSAPHSISGKGVLLPRFFIFFFSFLFLPALHHPPLLCQMQPPPPLEFSATRPPPPLCLAWDTDTHLGAPTPWSSA